MKKLLQISFCVIASACNAMEPSTIEPRKDTTYPVYFNEIQTQHSTQRNKLLYDGSGYFVKNRDGIRHINHYDIDPVLKNLNIDQMKKFEVMGLLSLKKLHNGDFKLIAKSQLPGGGIITGTCAYWITKSTAWAGVIVATVHDPELIIHYGEIHAAIETASAAALYIGTLAPTP